MEQRNLICAKPSNMKTPTVVLTRDEADNLRIAPLFEKEGLYVCSFPAIQIQNYEVETWEIPVDEPYIVLLTSSRATLRWLSLQERLLNHRINGYLIVGQTSATMLRDVELHTQILMEHSSIEELLEELLHLRHTAQLLNGTTSSSQLSVLHPDSSVVRVLYPCNARRRDEGVNGLRQMGYEVVELPLYEPVSPTSQRSELLEMIDQKGEPIILPFFSPSAVENFFRITAPDEEAAKNSRAWYKGCTKRQVMFASIGETTAEALYAHGVEDVIIAEEPKVELLVEAIVANLQIKEILE